MPLFIMHRNGNYFLKGLIGRSTAAQRLKILKIIHSKIREACFNLYGIHPIQEVLCIKINKDEEIIIREELKGHIYELCLVFM